MKASKKKIGRLKYTAQRGGKLEKKTLKKFLTEKRIDLYEQVNFYKDKKLSDNFTETDTIKLESYESQLELVKEIINMCVARNRY